MLVWALDDAAQPDDRTKPVADQLVRVSFDSPFGETTAHTAHTIE
jgi:hypothetical protein